MRDETKFILTVLAVLTFVVLFFGTLAFFTAPTENKKPDDRYEIQRESHNGYGYYTITDKKTGAQYLQINQCIIELKSEKKFELRIQSEKEK